MSTIVELNATEIATRLLPLLKEYAAKMADISERVVDVFEQYTTVRFTSLVHANAGRVICLRDALDKPVTDLAREASGLIEHSALEYHLRGELKLRLDEIEEHIRFSGVMVRELIKLLTTERWADQVRKLIEQSGRYKAPF
jgi:hypothetical protein